MVKVVVVWRLLLSRGGGGCVEEVGVLCRWWLCGRGAGGCVEEVVVWSRWLCVGGSGGCVEEMVVV